MMVVVVMSVMMIDRVSCIPGWLTTPYVVKDDLELLILLPPPRKSWGRGQGLLGGSSLPRAAAGAVAPSSACWARLGESVPGS